MIHSVNVPVPDAFEAFVLAKRSQNVVPGTLKLYRWTLAAWAERWPGLGLGEITPDHIRAWVLWLAEAKGIKSNTVHIHFRNIRAFLNWCAAEDLMAGQPLKNVRGPRVDEVVPDVLTEAEAAGLLARVKNSGHRFAFRDYAMHLFFLTTGARLAELAGLNLDDVNVAGGFALLTGKGRRQRMVPLFDVLPLEVKRYTMRHRQAQAGERALFVNENGTRLSAVWIEKVITADLKAFVPRVLNRTGPHTLRHTACTLLLRRLNDFKRVAMIMGHTNLETTERYTHLTFKDLQGHEVPTLDQLLKARAKRAG